MTKSRLTLILMLTAAWFLCGSMCLYAQKYKVVAFKMLENDVSAFITPVVDLNDEACALIKVQAPKEFAFSSPLGIVKRVDKTGEIWLYIPKGSKKITLKHPDWGVLRDYQFPSKIESHMSYEMKIDIPAELRHLSAAPPKLTVVHDTLVVTRTDTLMIVEKKKRIPLTLITEASLSIGVSPASLSGGVLLALMTRHGGFAHLSSNFKSIGKTEGECGRFGEIDNRTPYYSGETRNAFFMATAGAIHRVSDKVKIFEGLGYGSDNVAWQLAQSEGGNFVKNTGLSHSGVAFEVGTVLTFGKLSVSASVMSISGKKWYGSLGVGYTFSFEKRKK